MKLASISIEKLFGQFDYNIEFNQEEGITILTGPNGSGKTTILNIIWSLFTYGDLAHISGGPIPLSNVSISLSDGRVLKFPENKNDIKNLIRVYFIKDQRIKKTVTEKNINSSFPENVEKTKDAVKLLSQELTNYIKDTQVKENEKAQALNASYAERLFEYDKAIQKTEFEKRYEVLTKRYQLLQEYKIYDKDLAKAKYEGENQKALSIYLEDWEKKIAVYDELLDRIALFLSIMDSKGLVNKTFMINAKEGFRFTSVDNKPLQLTELSSGEQHQTILLYELLFNAPPDSLVLIDEPETSMHVSWQIEFLQDIEKIAKLSGLSFIIATHSPDLINDKMDLCVDLFENAQGKKQHG